MVAIFPKLIGELSIPPSTLRLAGQTLESRVLETTPPCSFPLPPSISPRSLALLTLNRMDYERKPQVRLAKYKPPSCHNLAPGSQAFKPISH